MSLFFFRQPRVSKLLSEIMKNKNDYAKLENAIWNNEEKIITLEDGRKIEVIVETGIYERKNAQN